MAFRSRRIRAQYVLVDKPGFIGLAPAHSPESFLEWSYGTAEIHDRGPARPCNAGEVKPEKRRIPFDEKRTDRDERRIGDVEGSNEYREKPVDHDWPDW